MAVNKVVYYGETLVDLTSDTVTPETLAEGATAHAANGEQIVGTMVADGGSINELPDYWEAHIAEKITTVRNRQRTVGKNGYSFVVMADFHHPGNADYSPRLIKRIAEACNIRHCLCLGDIQTGGALPKKEDVINGWEEIHDIFAPIRNMTLFTAGNHDGAYGRYDANGDGTISGTNEFYVYNFTREEIYDAIFRQVSLIPGVVFNDTGDGYYVDDTTHKVRYLLLNSQWSVYKENEDGTAANNLMRKCRFGQNQQNFAIAALKSIPDGDWTVVFGCHMPICAFPGDGGGGDLSLFREVLVAFQNRSEYSGTYGTVGEYDYVSVNVDFSDAKGRVVGAFSGHMHNDLLNTDYPFPIMTIAADNHTSFKDIEGGGITEVGELGTITEQAFDVMTVDNKNGVIYATRIGKGADRVISTGTAYLVSLNLDNSAASNTVESVLKNSAYTNTITPKNGYNISSVVVTMGGVDITNTAYSNGVINIADVTGDIVITVVTSQLYTNLADPTSEDWYTDSHWIKEQGIVIESDNAEYSKNLFVSNFIPLVKNDILRFKGVDKEALVHGSSPRIWWYDENKAYVGYLKLDSNSVGTSAGFSTSVVEDENGVTAYEILIRGDTNEQNTYKDTCNKVKYARFSAHYLTTVEDIIITVNEEIV